MVTYVSLLRGINVSGHRKVRMEELKRIYSRISLQNPRTYLQSGNVLFDYIPGNARLLAERIERAIAKELGLDVKVIIRDGIALRKVIQSNPFAGKDATKIHVTFLSQDPARDGGEQIDKAAEPNEAVAVAGSEIYLYCPNGYGRSRLSNMFFERIFGIPATTRNWRTVNALASMSDRTIDG